MQARIACMLVAGAAALMACGVLTDDEAVVDASTDQTQDHVGDAGGGDALLDAVDEHDADAAKDVLTSDAPHLHAKCAEAEDCDASDAVCCTTLTFDNANNQCLLDTLSAACAPASACPTTLQPFCTGGEIVHACDESSSCNEPEYPVCCTFWFDTTFTSTTTGLTICASQAAAAAADASCWP